MMNAVARERDHPGLLFTRLADDIFEIHGPSGRHYCIAMKPQGVSVRTLQDFFPDGKLPKLPVKSLIHRLLFAINWLHADCHIIHTDITPQNVLIEAEDDSTFRLIEDQEMGDPSVPCTNNGSLVYSSRRASTGISGHPILTDFGKTCFADAINTHSSMPDIYRAPEVLLGLPWDYPVDMWSVGILTLELLEGKNVFYPIDPADNKYNFVLALSQYIGLLGHPPAEMIKQSKFSSLFDEAGIWRVENYPIPQTSLSDFVTTIPPGEEKELFLKFIRKVLTWDQEVRVTANELAEDEWLMMRYEDAAG